MVLYDVLNNDMNLEMELIQADFDRLARFDSGGWDHNSQYHAYLLKQIPPGCSQALEIGCGTGSFSRLLAGKANEVTALDLSPEMINADRLRSQAYSNITYQTADVLQWDFPKNQFDYIVSIATLHHLPFETIIEKMKSGIKSNGVIMVLDLYAPEGTRDSLANLLAVPLDIVLKLKHTGRLREPRAVQEAWTEHGKHDTYSPISRVRKICDQLLPGAVIKRHLLWRYSIVWKKTNP
jgi:ubiquinone/menaquinone biosynthesis C-methylase UbiE